MFKNLHRQGLILLTAGGALCQILNLLILVVCWNASNAGPPRDDMGIAFMLFFAGFWVAGLSCVQFVFVHIQGWIYGRAPIDVVLWARSVWYVLLAPAFVGVGFAGIAGYLWIESFM